MWPWGHAGLGYLLYSLSLRATGRRVTGPEAVVLLVATQLPDLVDKPLAWQFDVVSSGYAVGHSLVVAVPLAVAVLALARRHGRPRLGAAFVVGHLSHLAGDVLVAVALSRPYTVERVLWPLVSVPGSHPELSFLDQIGYYGSEFVAYLGTTDSFLPTLLFTVPPVAAVALWVADGRPGLGTVRRVSRAVARKATDR